MALSSSVLPAVCSFLALPSQLTDKPLAQALSKQGVEGGRGIRGLRGDMQGWGGGQGALLNSCSGTALFMESDLALNA